jgi:fibronectin type 3 domain-containing protein
MMAKRRLAQIIVVFALFCLATPLYAVTPWLHTDANLIKDPGGNTVVLRGVDLIDLGSLQNWQGGVINMIDRLTNKTNTEGNSPGWYPRVIRIMITPPDAVSGWPYPFDPNNTVLYDLLRTTVNYCKTKDLYAIIDWHYVANTYDHVASTNAFWTYMAPRFAGDTHVIFELFNEPINDLNGDWIFNGNDTADWLSVRTNMQAWINIVRTYAPNNLIFVAGAFYSQVIGPAATYPLTGDNIVIVSHIYPGHWNDSDWAPSYKAQIDTALTRYPVFMSEWGFSIDASSALQGTITNYGQPLADFREARKISNSAWVASYNWEPPMFYSDWTLRVGEAQMGGFTKDTLYLRRNDNQPSAGDSTAPAAPTGLSATLVSSTVSLDWNNNGESDLYAYDIFRSTTSGSGYSKINLVRSKDSNYIDANIVIGTTYYYVVKAVDTSFNSSGYSSQVSVTFSDTTPPAAPTGLTATAGNGWAMLNWNNNNEGDLAGYNVFQSMAWDGDYIQLNSSLLSSSDYIDNTVTNGMTYYYIVTAVDTSSNESEGSNVVSATPQFVVDIAILGSWTTGTTHAKETGANRALVFVAHAESSSGSSSLTAVTYGGKTMTKIIDRLTGSGSNRPYVAAFILNDANITDSDSSGTFVPTWTSEPGSITYSSIFLKNVNQTALVGASASGASTSGATVSTSALVTSDGDMVLESAASSVEGTYSVTTGWAKDLDLSVSGYDGMGGHKAATGANETPSITQSSGSHSLIGFVVKVAAQSDPPPAAPTGLAATAGVGTVTLDWNNNTEPDLNGYNVYRSITSGSGYTKRNSSLLSSSNFADTNVLNGTTYYYVVTAVDNNNHESSYSNQASAAPVSSAFGTGAVLCEWWMGIAGDAVSDLTSDANYSDNPSGEELLVTLEGPVNWADNYGTRIRGYLQPTADGEYTFWIASDADSELHLATDDNPANSVLIASVPANPQSSAISLAAEQKYFIEVLHKAGTGDDNISVVWEGPGITQQVIDGIYLSPCCLEFKNFADFAAQWKQIGCNIDNDWCAGADLDRDGMVSTDDLKAFTEAWLLGTD